MLRPFLENNIFLHSFMFVSWLERSYIRITNLSRRFMSSSVRSLVSPWDNLKKGEKITKDMEY